MRCGEHPLVGNQNTSAIKNFFRPAENRRQERPVAGIRFVSANYPRLGNAPLLGSHFTALEVRACHFRHNLSLIVVAVCIIFKQI